MLFIAERHSLLVDNLSNVPDWLSDALCRASTGEGWVKRALYTDDSLSVLSFRRAIVLTSIDAGALRGDLGERLVPVELERITPDKRRTDADMAARFTELHPQILGALFDLVANVLARRDTVVVTDLPRMADFGRILAAIDDATSWATLDLYRASAEQVAADVLQGDPFAAAVIEFVNSDSPRRWQGSASDLYGELDKYRIDGLGWPKSPRTVSSRLTRLAPAFRTQGIEAAPDRAAVQAAASPSPPNDANDAPSSVDSREEEGETAD